MRIGLIADNPVNFPHVAYASGALVLLFQLRCCEVPVDKLVEEGLHKALARIAVVDVVRMLPDVAGNQRDEIARDRSVGVGCFHDFQRVAILYEPCPPATELRGRRGGEFGLELLVRTE